MRSSARWTTMTTAAVLALSLAPSLQAQRRGDRDDGRYRDRYPRTNQMERVAVLAHEIDDTAHSILRQAERNNRRPDRDEARMLASLRGLDQRTEHFHEQVESYRQDPRHTADDFAALESAFYEVEDALGYVRSRDYVDQGMERIYVLMNDVSRFYGRTGYGTWRDHGRGRYDGRHGRDRSDDRYDRDRDRDDDNDHGHGYRPPLHP